MTKRETWPIDRAAIEWLLELVPESWLSAQHKVACDAGYDFPTAIAWLDGRATIGLLLTWSHQDKCEPVMEQEWRGMPAHRALLAGGAK